VGRTVISIILVVTTILRLDAGTSALGYYILAQRFHLRQLSLLPLPRRRVHCNINNAAKRVHETPPRR